VAPDRRCPVAPAATVRGIIAWGTRRALAPKTHWIIPNAGRIAPAMTPRQLKTLGELLYGRRWKTYLADDLGVDRRTVMCWVQKEYAMPAARAKVIVGLANKRIVAIRAALKVTGGTRASAVSVTCPARSGR